VGEIPLGSELVPIMTIRRPMVAKTKTSSTTAAMIIVESMRYSFNLGRWQKVLYTGIGFESERYPSVLLSA